MKPRGGNCFPPHLLEIYFHLNYLWNFYKTARQTGESNFFYRQIFQPNFSSSHRKKLFQLLVMFQLTVWIHVMSVNNLFITYLFISWQSWNWWLLACESYKTAVSAICLSVESWVQLRTLITAGKCLNRLLRFSF
jgi:hypothetical protein